MLNSEQFNKLQSIKEQYDNGNKKLAVTWSQEYSKGLFFQDYKNYLFNYHEFNELGASREFVKFVISYEAIQAV